MTRRRRYLVAGSALVIVAVVVVIASTRSHHRAPVSRISLPSGRGSTPASDALARILAAEERKTFHAVYAVQSSTGTTFTATGGKVELWRKPPRIRQDVTLTAEAPGLTEAAYYTGSGTVVCVHNDAAWSCHNEASRQPSVLDQIAKQASSSPVVETTQTIGSRSARCFGAGTGGTGIELCATADGIPVRITSGNFRYVLTVLETAVGDDVFKLPATVSS